MLGIERMLMTDSSAKAQAAVISAVRQQYQPSNNTTFRKSIQRRSDGKSYWEPQADGQQLQHERQSRSEPSLRYCRALQAQGEKYKPWP